MSLGRCDEAADVVEHAMELSPARSPRAALAQFAGEMALARGDLERAAELAAACREAVAGLRYRDETHLPLARFEVELHLAVDNAADALAAAEQALDRFNLLHSPRYAWPLLAAGTGACAAVITGAAARDRDLASRARRLLDRLRGLAEKMGAVGPLQQAHRLTFAAQATRAGGAPAAPGTDPQQAWDAAAQASSPPGPDLKKEASGGVRPGKASTHSAGGRRRRCSLPSGRLYGSGDAAM